MDTLALVENEIPDGLGDHAAMVETSFMMYLHPRTVDKDILQRRSQQAPDQTPKNGMDPESAAHPCYGLVGIDPGGGNATPERGKQLTEALVEFLAQWVKR